MTRPNVNKQDGRWDKDSVLQGLSKTVMVKVASHVGNSEQSRFPTICCAIRIVVGSKDLKAGYLMELR